MRILVGRIIRGILRRVAVEVRSSVQQSQSTDRDAMRDPVILVMMMRLHAHPDVMGITLSPNWWGGFSVLVETDDGEFLYSGDDMQETLAQAISDLCGVDA
jgi:hypothetical protein